MVCKACTGTLRGWTNDKRTLNFGISMVWKEPKNMSMTATSALLMWLRSTEITVEASSILIFSQYVNLYLIVMKWKRRSGSWRLCSTSILPKGFEWSGSWHQLVSGWHPDWRKRTSSLTVLASASSATGIKSTSVCPLLWRIWRIVQISCNFCSSLECHSKDWRLFVYSNKLSLKCVLLHNGNHRSLDYT